MEAVICQVQNKNNYQNFEKQFLLDKQWKIKYDLIREICRILRGMEKIMKKQKQKILVLCILIIIVIAAIVLIAGGGRSASGETESQVQAGIQYLQGLEAQNTDAVEAELKEIRKQERIEALENGELDVWQQLEDAVILGDSRAVGFYYFGYMPETRVLAEGGATIRAVADHLDELETLNPAQVFFCYGLNDVSIGYWSSPAEYTAEMEEVMQSVWEVLPDTEIYISSILIARDPAFERASAWRDIPAYNDALKAMCEEKGYHFVDNSELCETYASMWDVDGIHVNRDFYPHWAANMVAATYEDE